MKVKGKSTQYGERFLQHNHSEKMMLSILQNEIHLILSVTPTMNDDDEVDKNCLSMMDL